MAALAAVAALSWVALGLFLPFFACSGRRPRPRALPGEGARVSSRT